MDRLRSDLELVGRALARVAATRAPVQPRFRSRAVALLSRCRKQLATLDARFPVLPEGWEEVTLLPDYLLNADLSPERGASAPTINSFPRDPQSVADRHEARQRARDMLAEPATDSDELHDLARRMAALAASGSPIKPGQRLDAAEAFLRATETLIPLGATDGSDLPFLAEVIALPDDELDAELKDLEAPIRASEEAWAARHAFRREKEIDRRARRLVSRYRRWATGSSDQISD